MAELCAFILKKEPALLGNFPLNCCSLLSLKESMTYSAVVQWEVRNQGWGCDDTRLWAWFVVVSFKWRQSDVKRFENSYRRFEVISSLKIKEYNKLIEQIKESLM